ncbi:MAG: hypothetical protein JWP12_3082 [Bacteroidetes bacterium]|nr:hypothetical protein [Bacteroidota bacterium]
MRNVALFLMLCFLQTASYAQLVGPDAYLKGTSVEVGINGGGGYEGVNTTTSPPLPGMHFRAGGSSFFGFVANPQVNAWSTFNGDFFTPGSSENGWGFEVGTVSAEIGSNNCNGDLDMPGSLNFGQTFNCYTSDWQGATSSGDLSFRVSYLLQQNDLYYTTTISVTNNTTAVIPEMYYYRNLDPDNNESVSGDFSTMNKIESQPASGCNLAFVSAKQGASSGSDPSFLGLAAIGTNWRACYGGFSNRDGSDLWSGIGPSYSPALDGTVNDSLQWDCGIALAYKISNLAPGATETFKFVTILDAASATNAINNLLYFSYPGSASAPPAVCTPYTDTVRTCGVAVPISVGGSIVGDFNWTWSPGTGLSSTTGSSVTAAPPVTTTYTITGTPITPCVAPVTLFVVVQVTPGAGVPPTIAAVTPMCVGAPPFNLSVDSAGGTWSGPGITSPTLGTFNPATAGVGSHIISYTIPAAGCPRTDTVLITVLNGTSANITQADTTVCNGSSPFNIAAATSGGTWSGTGITNASSGTFDPSTAGPGTYTIHYNFTGSCASTDSVRITVGTITTPITTFSYPASPVCTAGINPIPQGDPGFTTGGTYTSTPGLSVNSSTGVVNLGLSAAGTYTVTYHVNATGCGPAGSSTATVTIIPLTPAITNFSYNTPVCTNDTNQAPQHVAGFTAGGVYSSTAGLIINDSTGVINIAGSTPGTYTITYHVNGSNALCTASGTNTTSVTINPLPAITISSDVSIYIGESTNLFATGGTVYNWNPGIDLVCLNTNCDSIKASPTESTKYCVIVVDSVGCIDSSCVKVLVEIPCLTNRNLIVPNAFTPNADGVNDELCLNGWGDCVATFQIFIYDRWGEKVFESVDPKFCWDGVYKGKLMDPAVFVYYIKATYLTEGATITAPKKTIEINKKGNISLVR